MLSGDIELNPGPPRYPCGVSSRAVAKTHRAVLCDVCEVWQHIRCVNIAPSEYVKLNASDDQESSEAFNFTYSDGAILTHLTTPGFVHHVQIRQPYFNF